MPRVFWLHGPGGVNKSRLAHLVCKGSVYFKPPDSKWFNGYNGEDVVVLNDLRKSTFTFSYLLDLLDRYDFQVEVKGGYDTMLAKVFMITCSKPHDALWAELHGTANENMFQLSRRIHEEFAVTATNLNEPKGLLCRLRQSLVHLRDEKNWDKEEVFDEWDGIGPIPPAPPGYEVPRERSRSRTPRRVQAVALADPRMCNHPVLDIEYIQRTRLCDQPVLDTDYTRRIKYSYCTYPDGPGLDYIDHRVQ